MNVMRKTMLAAVVAANAAIYAAAPWSDTPVTCHWIGAVKAGTTTGGDYASWANADNWAEGIVPGMSIVNGVTNGCRGCTAVFDRPCTYGAVDLIYGQIVSISNIIVTGSTVPKITIGRPWEWSDPPLYLEGKGGVYVDADVVTAPEFRAGIKYLRGANGPLTTFYFENNSSTPLILNGFSGPDVAFTSWAGSLDFVLRGTGDIRQNSAYSRSQYGLRIQLEMTGGKYVQAYTTTLDYIRVPQNVGPQHFEIASGKIATINDTSMPVIAMDNLLIDGEGTCRFAGTANNVSIIGPTSGKTITFDCKVTRQNGGKFQIGHGGWNGGAIALTEKCSMAGLPIQFLSGMLKLADGMTFTNALSIMNDSSSLSGKICGGSEVAAKITGGVAGGVHNLLLTNRVAIASDITATSTLAAGSELSFCKADDEATAFTISSLKLNCDATVPVENGVTATITAINNNGHTLDICSTGSGKVKFPGLGVGSAPAWLTLNGGKARIAPGGTLTGPKGFCLKVR